MLRGPYRLAFLALIAAAPAARGGVNLVPNSSFERITDGRPEAWVWDVGASRGTLTVDDEIAHSGRRSLFIQNEAPEAAGLYSALRTVVNVVPGRTYTLTCHVRGLDPGRAWIGVGDDGRFRTYLPRGSQRWQRVALTFTAPSDQSSLVLTIATAGPTDGFWVDSVQLEEGTEATDYQSALAPGELRIVVESDVPVGDNLVPNGSFEMLDGGRPKHWTWDKRNTDATFEVVSDACTGRHAVRITNSTPAGAHVYGQMVLLGGLPLTPGETYTLSVYVKSDDPGAAWVGGGAGWWMRLPLAGTGRQWKRFTKTFRAKDGDASFPLMVNTDSPTRGFIVDNIKLERGEHATPFVDSEVSRPVDVLLDVPEVVSCTGTEVVFTAFAYLQESAPAAPALVTISDPATGQELRAESVEALRPGLTRLNIHWTPPEDAGGKQQLSLQVGQASTAVTFTLWTPRRFAEAERSARQEAQELQSLMAQAAQAGIPTDYARAALAVTRRFLRVARQKHDAGLIPEAVADAQYLATLCGAQSDALRGVMRGWLPRQPIPDPPLQSLTIRDGSFWAADQPVMLVGALGYGELEEELGTYRDYGFNVIGDDFDAFSAFSMLRAENQIDETAIPRLLRNWERLRGLNLAIAYNPTLHYFPEWALHQYPDITGGDPVDTLPDWSGLGRHEGQRVKTYGGFFPFAIDSPNLRRLVSQYYARLMPALATSQAFHVIWLMNEPTYRSQDEHYVGLFQQYLRAKFATIGRLNAAWGTHYTRFEDIGYPTQEGAPAKFDWLTFHQDQVASWFEWLAAQVKQHHPQAVLSNKPMAWSLLDPEEGIDFEREAELWEVPGCDAARSPGGDTYAFGWTEAAMLLDFQKSVVPAKPLADHEYHYVHWPNVTSEYVRATYFHSYLHGLRMSQFWVWATGLIGQGAMGAGMEHTAWSQPRAAWATASAALDLRRLARVISAFPTRPQVMLYYSRPSLYLAHATHRDMLVRAYEAANGLDAPLGFVTDKMIRAGKLSRCKLLIIPAASHVQADVLAAIQEYVKRGGFVVLLGDCLTRDEYGRPGTARLMVPPDRLRKPKLTTVEALVPVLDEAFTAAGVVRPIRALREDGSSAWPVECRSAVVDGARVCYLIGLNKEPMMVTLVGLRPVTVWQDLITGEEGEGSTFEVKPLDVRILRLART